MFSKIKNFVLDTLFPISCLSCGRPGVFLCDECLQKIEILSEQVCPYCEKNITPAGKICFACQLGRLEKNKSVPLDGLLISARYRDISHPAHVYKYNFVKDLAVLLSKLMERAAMAHDLKLPDLIVPVPLHRRRERWRGFNQAGLLAENLGKNLSPGYDIPMLEILKRKKFTAPQMKIKNYKEREKNIRSAFILNNPSEVELKNKKILLIDDISTTGSTLLECAKVLKSAGAASVWGMVLARQEYKSRNA